MCVCTCVARICFYPPPAPQPQRTGRSVSGLHWGLQTTWEKAGGGTTTGFIAWYQHVCTGWHAGQSHSLRLSCLKSREGVGEGRALISILEALPSCVLSRQSSVAQQVSRHLEAPGNSNAPCTQVLFM